MFIKKLRMGYCMVCKKKTVFVSFDNWLRESYKCVFCRSTPRERALMKLLSENAPDWKRKKVHESSPGGGYAWNVKK